MCYFVSVQCIFGCDLMVEIAWQNATRNRLDGAIPETLGSIDVLNSLNVSNNKLSGSIPSSLAGLTLSSIDFSNNQLSGAVPNSLISVGSRGSFSGNPGLCAKISSSDDTIAVTSTSSCAQKESGRMKLVASFIAGATVLILAVGLILLRYDVIVTRCRLKSR